MHRIKLKPKKCLYCGKILNKPPVSISKKQWGERKYCSKKCYFLNKTVKYVPKVCPICKKEFIKPRTLCAKAWKKRVYCSWDCRSKIYIKYRECPVCHKIFSNRERTFCYYGKNFKNIYCSVKCFSKATAQKLWIKTIRNGKEVGNEVSRQRRWQIRKKNEGRCIICGVKSKSHYCSGCKIKRKQSNLKNRYENG